MYSGRNATEIVSGCDDASNSSLLGSPAGNTSAGFPGNPDQRHEQAFFTLDSR